MKPKHSASSFPSDSIGIPVRVESTVALARGTAPVTIGLPCPGGAIREPFSLFLNSPEGEEIQTSVLDRWSDGSCRWVLADFLLPEVPAGVSELELFARPTEPTLARGEPSLGPSGALRLRGGDLDLEIATGSGPIRLCSAEGSELLDVDMTLRCAEVAHPAIFEHVRTECWGGVRIEALGEGRLGPDLLFRARVSYWPACSLLRLRLTLHNPRPAQHAGGLWDLGDPGSLLFDALDVTLTGPGIEQPRVHYRLDPSASWQRGSVPLHLYQDSSGGENWNSPNHVNAEGTVPCRFRGFELCDGDRRDHGDRASPVIWLQSGRRAWISAVPDFWQKFPKGVRSEGNALTWELFPGRWDDRFELQGGERTTHDLWLKLEDGRAQPDETLSWVHQPPRVVASPEWVRHCGVVSILDVEESAWDPRLVETLEGKLEGESSFQSRREIIDEYGWRNYGDQWADHEEGHFEGERPVISHYNNQYDVLQGFLLQWLRTGDRRWMDLALPLARHVMDIDIYHCSADRPAYSGGMFWHTDHYQTAATSTHRSYSRHNARPGQPYGGGPSNEHNYSSGLLLLHYLTGDPDAAETVRGLADWVRQMERGPWWLGRFASTGLSSKTRHSSFHGPGRGGGYSINALLDAWLLDGDRSNLEQAETLLRRCIHPLDDLERLELLDIENRWSYTVFLGVLVRYLEIKLGAGEVDEIYGYARACLLHYGEWMAKYETPYLDRPDELDYPTETWAAQDLRKSNALFAAATFAEEESAVQLRAAALRLADRAWRDLMPFPSRDHTRPIAILMTEGLKDSYHRLSRRESGVPHPSRDFELRPRVAFYPLRERLLSPLRRLRERLGRS